MNFFKIFSQLNNYCIERKMADAKRQKERQEQISEDDMRRDTTCNLFNIKLLFNRFIF